MLEYLREVDAPTSPLCRDREVTFSGVEETQVVRPSSPVKGLLRCGFFGLRAASPSPMVLKEASLSSKGNDPIPEFGFIGRVFLGSSSVSPSSPVVSPIIGVAKLGIHSLAATFLPSSQVCISHSNGAAMMETQKDPFNSSISTSQLWYTRRVKEKVAKQLYKNKDLLVKAVADIPVVGEGRVSDAMNLASVVGLSWGGVDQKLQGMLTVIDEPVVEASVPKVKGMRELKNLDCSISPVKGQC